MRPQPIIKHNIRSRSACARKEKPKRSLSEQLQVPSKKPKKEAKKVTEGGEVKKEKPPKKPKEPTMNEFVHRGQKKYQHRTYKPWPLVGEEHSEKERPVPVLFRTPE